MDQIKNFAEKKLDQNAQPGNDVERKADSGVNDSKSFRPIQARDYYLARS